ncbi:MAG: VOC family protein [Myxococcaceae bacterium]
MQLGGFHHVAVQVADVDRVARFYVQVLGLSEVRRFHRDDGSLRSVWVAAQPDAQGPFVAIEQLDARERGPAGYSMVAFRIAPEARQAVIAELAQHGVAIEKQSGWTIYVRDPEGNLVGLSHHPHDAVGTAR